MPSQRPVYFVADDAAMDAARDAGILRCIDSGVVKNLSVLAHGSALQSLADQLRARPGLGILLHLNLTWGRPLGGPAPSLTAEDGGFLGSKGSFWRRACSAGVDPQEVHAEARAQCLRLREMGLDPVGINGHNHVHVLPGVREGVARLMAEEPSLRWWRTLRPAAAPAGSPPVTAPRLPHPREPVGGEAEALEQQGERVLASFAAHSATASALLGPGTSLAGRFAGLRFSERPGRETLLAELAACDASSVEFMVHPGNCSGDSVPYSADPSREVERNVLSDAGTAEALRQAGWRPASVAE